LNLIPEILIWSSVFAMLHSYVIFPEILKFLAKNKKTNNFIWGENKEELPFVSVILASYNEEKNIEQKIISTLKTNYPKDKIEFLIGSDNSDDNTNSIIKKYSESDLRIKFIDFKQRNGKIKIINDLTQKAQGEILILTDTKIFFNEKTIYNLVKHFKNNDINIVGGIPENQKSNENNITFQENAYMKREINMKIREGLIWGNSMGVFGAIYAIRKESFHQIPEKFTADDFFVSMKVLENNGKIIFEPEATATQNLTGSLKEEYKRKTRISSGNFQNLKTFAFPIIFKLNSNSFCFISHKVIRWIGPFLILISVISNIFLLNINFYKISFLIFILSIILAILDSILKKFNINIKIIRFLTHFYTMNIALFIGFVKYIKGIENNIWQPSVRENK
jgi:cellulose synthase/poly-beta-1,6-N-acetylglucosamine synthase-like glycosyltransferase